jgi:SAM-dependent methyltransferase
MDLHQQMERIYRERALEAIPWNDENPPGLLVDLVESGTLVPGDAVDLGCGAGNHAVWLAERGFRVTGLDFSARATELATELAARRGVKCRFVVRDVTGDVGDLEGAFDFACDWEVLHHVFPDLRPRYVDNVLRLLRPGGRYLSVCFSEEDPAFGGEGKYRTTPLGTRLYFSSEAELRDLFAPRFEIKDLFTTTIGAHIAHRAVVAWLATV